MSDIIIDQKSALERLRDPRNLCEKMGSGSGLGRIDGQDLGGVTVIGHKYSTFGDTKEIPEEIRSTAGVLSRIKNGAAAARELMISGQTARAASKGLIYKNLDEDLKEDVEEKTEDIVKSLQQKALHRVGLALDHMTADKYEDAKLRDLGASAKDAAAVFEKLGPKLGFAGSGIQFVVHTVAQNKESDYTTAIIDAEVVR